MINANELRNGNIIGYYMPELQELQHGVVEEILRVPELNNIMCVVTKGIKTPINLEGLKSIILTPELLNKYGFINIGNTDFHNHIYKKDGFDFEFSLDDKCFIKNIEYGYYAEIGHTPFLHTFQNLYFYLADEELQAEL